MGRRSDALDLRASLLSRHTQVLREKSERMCGRTRRPCEGAQRLVEGQWRSRLPVFRQTITYDKAPSREWAKAPVRGGVPPKAATSGGGLVLARMEGRMRQKPPNFLAARPPHMRLPQRVFSQTLDLHPAAVRPPPSTPKQKPGAGPVVARPQN